MQEQSRLESYNLWDWWGLNPFGYLGDRNMGSFDLLSGFAPVSVGGGIDWGSVLGQGVDILTRAIGGGTGGRVIQPSPRAQIPSITGIPMPQTLPNINPTYRVNVVGRAGYRRMNACNPKALKRAIRRVKRFEKFAKQSIRISKKVKAPRRKTCR